MWFAIDPPSPLESTLIDILVAASLITALIVLIIAYRRRRR